MSFSSHTPPQNSKGIYEAQIGVEIGCCQQPLIFFSEGLLIRFQKINLELYTIEFLFYAKVSHLVVNKK